MGQSLTAFSRRRWRALMLTLLAGGILTGTVVSRSLALRDPSFVSGWILTSLVLFLAAYNLRKKLPYPPLLKSSTWLQLHIYGGVLCLLVFGLHTGLRMPDGILESVLAFLFVAVALSGLAGLGLSRLVPRRLWGHGEEVLFERIPVYRRQLRERAEQLVQECTRKTQKTTLAEFYTGRLADSFAAPRNYWLHLFQSQRPLHRLRTELSGLDRYFDDSERLASRNLADLIQAKYELDYHRAMQGLLKGWLFVHIPLTCAMLIVIVVHVVLVHAFFAGRA